MDWKLSFSISSNLFIYSLAFSGRSEIIDCIALKIVTEVLSNSPLFIISLIVFAELQKKLDPKTGQVLQENPDFLKNGDVAIVKIKPMKPIVLETQKTNPHMARFAIRDAGQTVAAGVCIDLVAKKI